MSSTAYYIGAIVESAIGQAAPWFILAVLLFSYAMRSVYIESCSLFVRGGVYRIVKEALGGFLAKAAVSALLFDYVLTGPISGVSAGQYIVGLDSGNARRESSVCRSTNRRGRPSRIGARWPSPAPSRCIFSAKTCWAFTNRAARRCKIMIATTVMARGHARLVRRHAGHRRAGQRRCPPGNPTCSKKVVVDTTEICSAMRTVSRCR